VHLRTKRVQIKGGPGELAAVKRGIAANRKARRPMK
jgi:hypothetical protein